MTNTRKYRCLIVDDEPIARKIVQNYIAQMPNLACAGECKNAFEAFEKINSAPGIDLLFLDINMPNLSGTALVKILVNRPQVIFTTAYSEFAVESYELNAVDYLLKPFLFERFAQAVLKAIDRLRDRPAAPPVLPEKIGEGQAIFIKSDGENHPVQLADILFCEAMKNYTKVVLASGGELRPLISISKFEEELAAIGPGFLRVHRSFLVSKKHFRSLGSGYLMVGGHKIPVGELYKGSVLVEIGGLGR